MKTIFSLAFAALAMLAPVTARAGAADVGTLAVEDAWSRATPDGASTAVGYLVIVNRGTAGDVLLGGTTDAASGLEIHSMAMAKGIMTMRQLDGLAIPAGATVKITPQGGYHLMFTGLKAPLRAGAQLGAVLRFEKAGAVRVQFAIAPIGAMGPPAPSVPSGMDSMPGMH